MEEGEAAAAAAAAVGFLHFDELVVGVLLDQLAGLGSNAEALLQVAGVVEGHLGHVAVSLSGGFHLIHMEDVDEELVDIHHLGGDGFDDLAVFRNEFHGVVGPPFLQGSGAGTAGGEDVVHTAADEFLGDDGKVLLGFLHEAGAVAGGEGGNAAAGEVGRHDNAHTVMLEHLEAGFANAGVVLVGHAAGEEQHRDAAARRRTQFTIGGVQGLGGQLGDVAGTDELAHQGHIVGLRALLAHDDALEGGGGAHGGGEELGMREELTEDQLLDGIEAAIFGEKIAGFHEDVEDFHAGGAVGLAGAAEQAAVELFVNSFGILDDLVSEIVEEGELAAGHVGFLHRSAEDRADRLAEAAAHAAAQLVVQLHQLSGKTSDVAHD